MPDADGVYPLTVLAGLRYVCRQAADDVPDDAAGLAVALALDALTLDGVLAVTLDAVVLEGVLDTDALPEACARDADDTLAVLPVLFAVAMPPLVDTRLVKTLSAPVLWRDPCQLSSFI